MIDEDKTLLEMAAKAAGIVGYRYVTPDVEHRLLTDRGITVWNPLADDGDALRLAVKLGLDVTNGVNPSGESVIMVSHADNFGGWFEVPHCADPYAATRRAIVRAAAEIGKVQQ